MRHFFKIGVVFNPVAAGNEREALLQVAEDLCAALGYEGGEKEPVDGASALGARDGNSPAGVLSYEDERLVRSVRTSLAKVAAAVDARRSEEAPMRAVGAALDGAEMMMRGELASGNAAQLPALLPSFVFLVALPIVKQDEAIELSRRTRVLIERALGG